MTELLEPTVLAEGAEYSLRSYLECLQLLRAKAKARP
jgi:hypothetical protein